VTRTIVLKQDFVSGSGAELVLHGVTVTIYGDMLNDLALDFAIRLIAEKRDELQRRKDGAAERRVHPRGV
jgi:hypothetical protein